MRKSERERDRREDGAQGRDEGRGKREIIKIIINHFLVKYTHCTLQT